MSLKEGEERADQLLLAIISKINKVKLIKICSAQREEKFASLQVKLEYKFREASCQSTKMFRVGSHLA